MGSLGAKGGRGGGLGVPGLGGFHIWCGLDGVGVLGTDARTGLGEWAGPERAVGFLGVLVGAVFGGQRGSVQVSSIVVQYVDHLPW